MEAEPEPSLEWPGLWREVGGGEVGLKGAMLCLISDLAAGDTASEAWVVKPDLCGEFKEGGEKEVDAGCAEL